MNHRYRFVREFWQVERTTVLIRWTAASVIGLLLATWPLWTLTSEFPAVPLWAAFCQIPPIADQLLFACLLLLLIGTVCLPVRAARPAAGASVAVAIALACLDQHRLQPWLYQWILFGAIICLCNRQTAWRLLGYLVISVYVYSALGKLDYEFLHTVGQQFYQALWDLFLMNQAVHQIGEPDRLASRWQIALLPLAELLIALGLIFPASRRLAGVAAMGLHTVLVLVLGPLGLNHSTGVLIWNVQFAVQSMLLFVLPRMPEKAAAAELAVPGEVSVSDAGKATASGAIGDTASYSIATDQSGWLGRVSRLFAVGLLALVVLLPMGERFGLWDHWLSWALYAPHSSRAEIWVASQAVQSLPQSLQKEMIDRDKGELWTFVPVDRWSLDQTLAPIVPQARFQLGVARYLSREVENKYGLRVVLRSVADRMTGRRQSRELVGIRDIEAAERNFLFNSRPRAPQE